MGSRRHAVCASGFAFEVVFLAVLFAVPARAANPTFDLKTVPVAGGVADLRTADLDHDGIPDLVTLTPAGITVLFGDGQGNFARVDVGIGNASSLQIADFDGDGRPDLAVASNHQIAIFLNNGDRTFHALPPFTPPNWQGSDFAAADFNGDHRADLVLSLSALDVSILVGNGDGTFKSARSVYTAVAPSATEPFSVSGPFLTGDFNGDGRADVAFAEGPLSTFGGVNVTVLLNQGSLVFTHTQFQEGDFTGASVLDANGDSIDDIGFGWEACHTPCAGADVWTGTHSGSMAKFLIFATNTTLQSLALYPVAADFNGDGTPDVAFSMSSNSGFDFPPVAAHQSVLMFVGPIVPGQSPPPTPLDLNVGTAPTSLPSNPAPMVTADFNLDGKPDIAVITEAHDGIVLMLNTTATGTFTPPPRDFGFSIQPPSATVKAGQAATFTATVSRVGAFADNVSFSCTGLPAGAACAFNPASVTPAANAPASTTITISTTARTSAALIRHSNALGFLLPVFAVAIAGIGWSSKTKTRVAGMIVLAVLLIGLAACGGASGKPTATATPPTTPTTTPPAPTPPAPTPPVPTPTTTGTPAGTYTVTVTATSTGASPIVHAQTLTLVVQ